METDRDSISDLNDLRESAEFVSRQSFRLLRLNVLLIGIYLTVGGYLSGLDPLYQEAISTSYWMIASVILLPMSILVGYLTYESSGRLAALHLYENPGEVVSKYKSTERLVFNLRYAVLLTLLSGLSFGFGIIDGIAPDGIGLSEAWQFVFFLLALATLPILAYSFISRSFQKLRDVGRSF